MLGAIGAFLAIQQAVSDGKTRPLHLASFGLLHTRCRRRNLDASLLQLAGV